VADRRRSNKPGSCRRRIKAALDLTCLVWIGALKPLNQPSRHIAGRLVFAVIPLLAVGVGVDELRQSYDAS